MSGSNQLEQALAEHIAQLPEAWRETLSRADTAAAVAAVSAHVAARLESGAVIYPARPFRALESLTPDRIRVVIIGQDPYHGPDQAQGLAFSVPDGCRRPPSLRNIFKEIGREWPDLGEPRHNDLTPWMDQGVFLLNTSLTVEQGQAASHAKRGWEAVTDALIARVARDPSPKVFMLWGAHAQAKAALLSGQTGRQTPEMAHDRKTNRLATDRLDTDRLAPNGPAADHLVLQANHPSPLSASRPPIPFVGCGHFSRANAWLREKGQSEIDWRT